jgi:hypothetical protein
MLAGLLVLILAVAAPFLVRWVSRTPNAGPAVSIVLPGGRERRVDLKEMRRLPVVVRRGEAQNQYGNWRDAGVYTGILLADLLRGIPYDAIETIAADGYRVTIERARVDDAEYPMVLAYALDGTSVPTWTDGFQIVVLPDDGRVSNEEYKAVSAGSYWVKNVARIVILPAPTTAPADAP